MPGESTIQPRYVGVAARWWWRLGGGGGSVVKYVT
ncbi:unnamed protein product [Penicillium camemberti]|uniref:Str. FM013 n=1 Tax=Penicillium camemberti (strain FM 013) TaxID=1429867 RepID=A0A0G4PV19_PENC3|nr:unnamed protein product [Penicillium camemberti]